MPQSFNLEGIPLELLDVGELALIHQTIVQWIHGY
jgi:hypothetical protein